MRFLSRSNPFVRTMGQVKFHHENETRKNEFSYGKLMKKDKD